MCPNRTSGWCANDRAGRFCNGRAPAALARRQYRSSAYVQPRDVERDRGIAAAPGSTKREQPRLVAPDVRSDCCCDRWPSGKSGVIAGCWFPSNTSSLRHADETSVWSPVPQVRDVLLLRASKDPRQKGELPPELTASCSGVVRPGALHRTLVREASQFEIDFCAVACPSRAVGGRLVPGVVCQDFVVERENAARGAFR
jgi:hypothetical protein